MYDRFATKLPTPDNRSSVAFGTTTGPNTGACSFTSRIEMLTATVVLKFGALTSKATTENAYHIVLRKFSAPETVTLPFCALSENGSVPLLPTIPYATAPPSLSVAFIDSTQVPTDAVSFTAAVYVVALNNG